MNRLNLQAFNRLKLAKWDELNVVRDVNSVYDFSARQAVRRYYEIAVEAFIIAMIEANQSNAYATRRADQIIDNDWVMELLEMADPVTMYMFFPEMDRKKQRLLEAMTASDDRNREIDRALKYWTVQVAQYADNMVYRARLEAFRQAGIDKVMWVTQKDNRVCTDCDDLDGQTFQIDQVPPPQHIHCRCYIKPVIE